MKKKKELIRNLETQLNLIVAANISMKKYKSELTVLKRNLENSPDMQIVQADTSDFHNEFSESNSELTYNNWLEKKLSESRCLINIAEKHISQNPGNKKNVTQLTIDGSFIQSFNSVTEAAISTGVSRPGISRVINGVRTHAGGYKWSFREDIVEKEDISPF